MDVSLFGSALSTFTLVGGMSAYHVFSLVYDPVAGSADPCLWIARVGRLSNYPGAAPLSQQLVGGVPGRVASMGAPILIW